MPGALLLKIGRSVSLGFPLTLLQALSHAKYTLSQYNVNTLSQYFVKSSIDVSYSSIMPQNDLLAISEGFWATLCQYLNSIHPAGWHIPITLNSGSAAGLYI